MFSTAVKNTYSLTKRFKRLSILILPLADVSITQMLLCLNWFIRPTILLPLAQLYLYPFDDLSNLLPGAIGEPGIVNAVL
jgi:hypothetical protein